MEDGRREEGENPNSRLLATKLPPAILLRVTKFTDQEHAWNKELV